jgi:membrane associated rhomboid family serine protease
MSFPPFTKAVKWLVIINAGLYLLMALLHTTAPALYASIMVTFGLAPVSVVHGAVWQIVTYSFLHGGLFHVLFNMLWLWMFGAQFESDWGRKQFLEFYFFCVVGAALVTIALSYTGVLGLSPVSVTIGASGGIYGILMAFGIIYANREIFLFPLPFAIKAKYFVGLLIFIAVASTLGGPGGINNLAHLGGALFGWVYLKFLPGRGLGFAASERYYGLRNSYYRWKRRRAARKFEVYMRKHDRQPVDRSQFFDEYGNYRDPKSGGKKKDGESKSGWIN